MNVFQFFIVCTRTNNANNATHYVKLGKKRRESSKRNYYIISPRVIIKAIINITFSAIAGGDSFDLEVTFKSNANLSLWYLINVCVCICVSLNSKGIDKNQGS